MLEMSKRAWPHRIHISASESTARPSEATRAARGIESRSGSEQCTLEASCRRSLGDDGETPAKSSSGTRCEMRP
eukprot:3837609-Pyramimonas_sp.AAC.1